MWKIERTLEGSAARPNSVYFGDEVDAERFALWVAVHATTGERIPLYVYLPKDAQTCEGLIFSIHGKLCNANKYRNIFVKSMQDRNVMLVAPKLETEQGGERKSWRLNMGNMYSGLRAWREGRPNNPADWTFNIINDIYRAVREEFTSMQYYSIFGHSAGSQFAHRMALFSDHEELFSVVAANPGWFTAMDRGVDFPYGIKNLFSDEQIRNVLSKRLVILSGREDTEDDGNVRQTESAMKQGKNRHERALSFYRSAIDTAKKLDTHLNWELIVKPDLNHSSKQSAPIAMQHLIRG